MKRSSDVVVFCRVKSGRTKQLSDELIRDTHTHTHLAGNFRSIDFYRSADPAKDRKGGEGRARQHPRDGTFGKSIFGSADWILRAQSNFVSPTFICNSNQMALVMSRTSLPDD